MMEFRIAGDTAYQKQKIETARISSKTTNKNVGKSCSSYQDHAKLLARFQVFISLAACDSWQILLKYDL